MHMACSDDFCKRNLVQKLCLHLLYTPKRQLKIQTVVSFIFTKYMTFVHKSTRTVSPCLKSKLIILIDSVCTSQATHYINAKDSNQLSKI
jgi:hypothetical protein